MIERENNNRLDRKTEAPKLSVNEGALAYAMLHDLPNHVTQYQLGPDGARQSHTLGNTNWPALLTKFRADPKETIATARLNVLAIARDSRLPESEKTARVERYLQAYLELQIKLDIAVYPNMYRPQQGVPPYIPDGLIDMGSDDRVDSKVRSREMLHVDKTEIFKQMHDRFMKFFTSDKVDDSSSTEIKTALIRGIARIIYNSMPVDFKKLDPYRNASRIVGVHEALTDKLAVCRHHALYTQVLLQAFGITGRLLKCDVDFGDGKFSTHAANVVRINGQWFLLDATNPDSQNGVGEVFLAPLPDADINPNDPNPKEWVIPRKNRGENWRYRSRNNMFYMIQHTRA